MKVGPLGADNEGKALTSTVSAFIKLVPRELTFVYKPPV